MNSLAAEYAATLDRPANDIDVPFEQWQDELRGRDLPEHVFHHLLAMAGLHAANRYDRPAPDVDKITGRPAKARDFVARHADRFGTDRGT